MKKFIVDRIGEDCIRVYPEKQEDALKQTEVRKRKVTLYDYGKGNGFSITPQSFKQQKGTIFKVKEFPLVSLHESKNKFFVRIAFTKATIADAETILLRDYPDWFACLQERLNEEAEKAVAEATSETKSKTKTQKTFNS